MTAQARARGVAAPLAALLLVTGVLTACGSSRGAEGSTAPATDSPPATAAATSGAATSGAGAGGLPAPLPCPAASPSVAPVAGGLPDVALACLGGGPSVRLSGLRGTPTVVNLWASWCAFCRDEVPHLRELAERNPGSVRVIGVAYQDKPSDAAQAAAELRLGYPSLLDPDGTLLAGRAGLPVTLLVAGNGKVVRTIHGAVTSTAQIAALVQAHLGVSVR